LAKRATSIATGSPVENYNYPKGRTHYVGIPVSSMFRPVNVKEQQKLKAICGLHDTKKPLVVVTGGGLGARNVNRAIVAIAPKLLEKAAIIHITGDLGYKETLERAPENVDYIIKPFMSSGMAPLFGAADIVVSRAGATTIQELAAMGKPVVLVPNPLLTGGHQLKNAEVYDEAGAAVIVDEDKLVVNPLVLQKVIEKLLDDDKRRIELGNNLHKFARPEAAVDTAALIVEAVAAKKHQDSVR
jgi:UDP-N-acetylglucosamine--N-acetylmuramyl-(pentapeptide) pyrophosphoryl-undecaprenol N-acetylglucosamine transferase